MSVFGSYRFVTNLDYWLNAVTVMPGTVGGFWMLIQLMVSQSIAGIMNTIHALLYFVIVLCRSILPLIAWNQWLPVTLKYNGEYTTWVDKMMTLTA